MGRHDIGVMHTFLGRIAVLRENFAADNARAAAAKSFRIQKK